MKLLKDIAYLILAVIIVLIFVPLALALVAYVGYFFGIVLAWLAGYVLATNGINTEVIPTVIAWLFVFSAILGAGNSVKAGDNE